MKYYFNGVELISEYEEYSLMTDPDFEPVYFIQKAKSRRKIELFGRFEKSTSLGDIWYYCADYYMIDNRYMSIEELEEYHNMVFTGRW